MKRCSVIVALLAALSGALAQDSDDQYVQIYNLIQAADKLNSDLQASNALAKYLKAQTALQRFQRGYPNWNPKVISFRLSDLATKIDALSAPAAAPAAATPGTEDTNAARPPSTDLAQATKVAPSDWEAQLAALKNQSRQLQADKAVLQTKLNEALSIRPAAADPRELTRAEEKTRNLQKEKDLPEVGLDQPKAKFLSTPDTQVLDEERQAPAKAVHARQPEPLELRQPAAVARPSNVNYELLLLGAALGAIVPLAASVWIVARRRQSRGLQRPALLSAGTDDPLLYRVLVGTRSATEAVLASPAPSSVPQTIIHVKAPGTTQSQAEILRQRALIAEQRAEHTNAMLRKGLIPYLSQWLKQTLVRKLIVDRAQLLETQQMAVDKVLAVEERLSRIEQQVQQQHDMYQAHIEALTQEFLTAKEENRGLIQARITQVQAEMEATRARQTARPERDNRASS